MDGPSAVASVGPARDNEGNIPPTADVAEHSLTLHKPTKAGLRSPTSACANVRTFTTIACLCLLMNSIIFTIETSTITTVQKAFGLSSVDIGIWFTVYVVGEIVSGILVSYFTNQSRIPRVLGISMLFTAISCFTHIVPHLIYDQSDYNTDEEFKYSNSRYVDGVCASNQTGFCDDFNAPQSDGSSGSSVSSTVLGIYIAANALLGIGYAPIPILPLVYVDDNANTKADASFYQGLLFGVYYFGYVVGYVMSAATLTLYVDLTEVPFGQDDARWIGAWWLGYAICGVTNTLLAVVIFVFPASIPKAVTKSTPATDNAVAVPHEVKTEYSDNVSLDKYVEVDDYKEQLPSPKLFFPTLWSFIKNPVYLFTALTLCTVAWIDSGFFSYLPKYLEVQFHQSAPAADLETGISSSLISTFSVMAGGWVVSRFKLNIKQCAGMLMTTYILGSLLYMSAAFFSCPQNIADFFVVHQSSYDCSGKEYYPVCMNKTTYFSPCHAGCQNFTAGDDNKVDFLDCSCSAMEGMQATAGICKDDCGGAVMAYLAIVMLAYALPCFATLAGLSILLRCVNPEQRSFSLGIYYEFTSLIGWLPAPIVYGAIIDTTCLTWDGRAYGCSKEDERGNCVQYNNTNFRFSVHSLTFGSQLLGFIFASSAWLMIHFKEKRQIPSESHPEASPANTNETQLSDYAMEFSSQTCL